jgi:hypothetical protein
MSREESIRERFNDNSPAYNLQGSVQRHQKELLLEILIELAKLNDREEEKASAKEVKTDSSPVARQKVNPAA